MIAHEDLRTLKVYTDWDLPLVSHLKDIAVLYYDRGWFEGDWEELEALVAELLGNFGSERRFTKKLRQLYNGVVVERQKHDFALESGDDDGGEELWAAQQALVDELLEYHDDPEGYIVVHAVDEIHGDEAWFLCGLTDVESLEGNHTIRA